MHSSERPWCEKPPAVGFLRSAAVDPISRERQARADDRRRARDHLLGMPELPELGARLRALDGVSGRASCVAPRHGAPATGVPTAGAAWCAPLPARRREAPAGRLGQIGDNVTPPGESPGVAWRRVAHSRRRAARKYTRNLAVTACGRWRVASVVPIVTSSFAGAPARASFRSLAHCGLVWLCPVCSSAIRHERAAEVKAVLRWHREKHENGADLARMLSLTVAHEWGTDLRRLRSGVADAWRRMTRGAPWQRFVERVGLVGIVRALDTTHGGNGWHPHLHVLLLVRDARALDEDREWLSERWRACVVRELGPEAEPSTERGAVLTGCDEDGAYLAKLGLEVVGVAEKSARQGHRSPWEILRDLDTPEPSPRDVALWREWEEGQRGARMLTWSRGLRQAAGVAELSDAECVEREEAGGGTVVCELTACEWDAIRDVPGLPALVLEAAELGGSDAVFRLVGRVRAPPSDTP